MSTDIIEAAAPAANELLLHAYAEDAYLDYAMAVVKDRALGQVEDGCKPVHRRILYAMQQLGLRPDGKPVKSARIVGDVLGKYHPHGDTAAYDALVRLAQPFSMRYPLISGQGNFGSRDGDRAAAMRYTEARLSPLALLMLDELGAGTVDFRPNYDGSQEEPTLLPSRLPFMLLNGTMGIAVGLASNIPPHNLREVAAAVAAMLLRPEMTTADVLELMPGPDFPDGGQLINSPAEIAQAYEGGRGSLRLRARWKREDLARGQWQVVVNELPYQVSVRQVLEQLDALSNPQPPAGKKQLTQQQLNLKAMALEFLETARDESGKEDAVRLVLVPRTSKVDQEQMMAFLLANTSLEETFGLNATMIGLDGRPQTKGLVAILREWCDFRLTTVRRRTQHELDVATRRIHILEGRMTVFLSLDAVIRCIREAEEPRQELMDTFSLTDIQATDILEMRLRQLNKLEGIRIERELAELRAESERLTGLLGSDSAMRALVVSEVQADAAKFGDDRRTVIEAAERVTASSAAVRTVPDEEVTVVVSRHLWVKAYRGHDIAPADFNFKPGDGTLAFVRTRTVQSVHILDSRGRAYEFEASQAPMGRGDGSPLSAFIELQAGAKVSAVLAQGADPEDTLYLFGGERGYGFLSPLKSLAARPRAGKAFLTLQDGELPFAPLKLPTPNRVAGADSTEPELQFPGYVACASSDGRLLAFPPAEVKELGGGKGVMLMVLDDGQSLTSVRHIAGDPFVGEVEVQAAGGVRRLAFKLAGHDFEKHVGHRARKGSFLPKKGILRD